MFEKITSKLFKGPIDPVIARAFKATLVAMIVSEFVTSLATMIDGIILARYLGENAIAAHGLTSTYNYFVKVLIYFFSTGAQVSCSESIARMDLKEAKQSFTISAIVLASVSTFLAILFIVFADPFSLWLGASKDPENLLVLTSDYIKGMAIALPFMLFSAFLTPIMALNGDKKRIAISVNVMIAANILGDLLNVFVFKGGMFGMAMATAVSYIFSFLILISHFFKSTGITFDFKELKPSLFKKSAVNGILPSTIKMFATIRSYFINIIFVSAAGTAALAANSLVQNNIKVIFICIANGIASTALLISSLLYTEKDRRGLHQLFKSVIRVCVDPCIAISIAMMIFAPLISSLFGAGEHIFLTTEALRMYMPAFPVIIIKMFYEMYFNGTGQKKLSMFTSIVGECIVFIPVAFLLGKYAAPEKIFLTYPISEYFFMILLFIVIVLRCKRLPRSLDDLLLLSEDFASENNTVLDVSIDSIDEVISLSEQVRSFCRDNNISEKKGMLLALAVEEEGSNIFEHGMDDGKKHFVDLRIDINGEEIIVRFRDDCRPFNPKEMADKLSEQDPTHNIGLRMLSSMAKDIQYANVFNLNELVITL